MFGVRLLEAPHICGVGENEPNRENFQLLVVLFFFRLDLHVFCLFKPATFSGGDIEESATPGF